MASRKRRNSVRKLVRTAHLVLGLTVGVYLLVISLTGALITWGHEVDAWLNPELHHVIPGEARVPLDTVVAAAQAAVPEEHLFRLRWPGGPDESVMVYGDWKPTMPEVFIDPYTGQVLGVRQTWQSLVGLSTYLHIALLLPANWGTWLNGYLGLVSGLILLTGLVLWWPKTLRLLWRRLTVRWTAPLGAKLWDMHAAVGAWTLTPTAILLITGLVFCLGWCWDAVQWAAYAVTGSSAPVETASMEPQPGPAMPLEDLLQRSWAQVGEDARLNRVWFWITPEEGGRSRSSSFAPGPRPPMPAGFASTPTRARSCVTARRHRARRGR